MTIIIKGDNDYDYESIPHYMWAGDCIEHNYWLPQDRHGAYGFQLPKGSIKKLIGRELFFPDEPVELK